MDITFEELKEIRNDYRMLKKEWHNLILKFEDEKAIKLKGENKGFWEFYLKCREEYFNSVMMDIEHGFNNAIYSFDEPHEKYLGIQCVLSGIDSFFIYVMRSFCDGFVSEEDLKKIRKY